MTRRSLVILIAATAACSPGAAPVVTVQPLPVIEHQPPITAGELRSDVMALAADSMMGRETGTPGARRAAEFLVARLMEAGLQPAGDSLYYHRVPLVRQTLGPGTQFRVTDGTTSTHLRLSDDLAPLLHVGGGLPGPKRAAEGELAFAGYGIVSPELGRNDFSGVALNGRVVVIIHGAPPGVDDATREELEAQGQLSERIGRVLAFRPAGVIVLMTGGTEAFYSQLLPDLTRNVALAGAQEPASDADRPVPMILFGLARPGSPLLPAGWPADNAPQELGGRSFNAQVEVRRVAFTGYNVVAVVRGRDPRLARTYVSYGAHYDHIGIMPPAGGDSIANGADDNASGSAALLAVARRMQANPPRRSALFVWHTGEEKGLLGSEYFVSRPTVPVDSIVAHFNADMLGRNHPDSIHVIGPAAAPEGQSRVLGRLVDSVNLALPRPFAVDRVWDDPDHPEQIYYRSDHISYAHRGIPVIFFTTGLHDDYHAVTDRAELLDYDKLARAARLLLDAGYAVGERDRRPR